MKKKAERGHLGIITDCEDQRESFREVLGQAGYRIGRQLPARGLSPGDLHDDPPDAWLVGIPEDAQQAAALEGVLRRAGVRVHQEAETATGLFGEDYLAWQRHLVNAVAKLLASPAPQPEERAPLVEKQTANGRHEAQDFTSVWVLASSLGGPPAVKEFLDALSPGLPLAMIYAQHIESAQQDSLVRVLARHSHYDLCMAEPGACLAQGVVAMLPVTSRYEVSATGQFRDTGEDWQGPYNPCLDQVIESVAKAFGARAGAIVFSGMGDDGSQGCRALESAGGQVWAQDAGSCGCSSMPDATRAACQHVHSGTPAALAGELSKRLGTAYSVASGLHSF